ncbi:c-type cytochrome [Natronogracilivirga saccharolytica]|uniref:Cytochrome c n=1 Tax=Natronogracilivirga saccharolytica TaxID=2812953 RepID=A0A8J7RI67_9BACT|nr:cytochrome c [Natronogracilivirga saccharolytica]MBP3191070.1 cytochrome c [Natronogracilivirga saccharolytica]
MKNISTNILYLLFLTALLGACRGQPSDKPPIHTQYNMYWQERFNTQQENPFFADGRSARMPVEGTVARGLLEDDPAYYQGINDDGSYVDTMPVDITRSFLMRGQHKYDVYCAVCHGGVGDGGGPVSDYGYVAASLLSDNTRDMPDGEIYSAIYNGVRTMNSYRHQIKVEDRWAIVAYVRALQLSQDAGEEELRDLGIDPAQFTEND